MEIGTWATTAALVLACAMSACGKKGPPLTPFTLIPGAPTVQVPRRSGADVYVQIVVPETNIDRSKPAAVSSIELYAVTAMAPPPRARFLDIATLVATIPVAPAGEPGDAVVPVPDPNAGALQGAIVTIRETLTDETLAPRELPVTAEARARAAPVGAATPPPANLLRRFYMAIAFSPRKRPGPASALAELPVTVLPAGPPGIQLTLTETVVQIQWEPAGGLLGWILDRALPDEGPPAPLDVRPPAATPPVPPSDWLPGPTRYNVYREISPDPLAPPGAASIREWQLAPPSVANPMPLAALRFDDPIVFDDRERCYHVRAVRNGIESAASPRRCLRAVDIFPPATPTGLATIISAGAINLIWDPNVEEDLGGYIVLRREAGGATLLPLTSTPTRETRFTDRTVQPGVRYTYEVRAVDDRVPVPNMSEPAEVSETLR